ncbi:hypothetical protein V490_05830 [Pseudogymnoascus sp. VKM F-3557]|nr:hypothetical protein V490_05830 [Pseudogymnoascus sp. VKM F-3557]
MASVVDLRFEHYHPKPTQLQVTQDTAPRLSWTFQNASSDFSPQSYDVEVSQEGCGSTLNPLCTVRRSSSLSRLVPWPLDRHLLSREKISVRVRAWDSAGQGTPWSAPARLEIGLLSRDDWHCERIAAPWAPTTTVPDPEQLYRKEFSLPMTGSAGIIDQARLYITAQGVYEAEINGQRVGDIFMAPGWTAYDARLPYQTYDVTSLLAGGVNCLGVRVAEGWFSGRIGFEGGHRNIWGPHTALMAQLEIRYVDGQKERIVTDGSWQVTRGPIRLAEIYDGEKYDATLEIPGWSSPAASALITSSLGNSAEISVVSCWEPVLVMDFLPATTNLTTGFSEPVRRTEVINPVQRITTPAGKTVIDFGQNLVGFVRLKTITGPRGHQITLSHVEVLENGEIATRPLRVCKAVDVYTLKGDAGGEHYEPRFTFHGFRYVQVDGWNDIVDLSVSIEAVVCHTDMSSAGTFDCSDTLLNKLYQNIRWGMRGNFLSVPTDCPQRDERLGWSGDLALFAPAASLIYDCFGMLKNWLVDVEYDQKVLGGVPAMVTPNSTIVDPVWCRRKPCAVWHDVTILAPWELYNETGDVAILTQQYASMTTWIDIVPRRKTGAAHLWDPSIFQLGDWLDPAAPADAPWKSATDAQLVANAFLVHSLDLMTLISRILGHTADCAKFSNDALATRQDFQNEYVSPNGRLVSDSQTAYALAICFDLLTPAQVVVAGNRLKYLVHKNGFRIGTGFAGTPFLCEALARTGHTNIAYAMLLEKTCPSWLYPVTMGATTMWERWDSLLPDGSVNPGEMTSFNHYAFGAIAIFLHGRVAGLRRLAPGWTKCCFAPLVGADLERASVEHVTPFGVVSCAWETKKGGGGVDTIKIQVSVPYGVTLEVVVPQEKGEKTETVGVGEWVFESRLSRDYEWPIKPLPPKS